MKAIIEISARNSIFNAAMADIAAGGNEDFHLGFESARQLFAEITPARLNLLDTLRKNSPCSIYALAKAAARNYSNDHTDIARLIDLGLIEKTGGEMIHVPFDDVEVHLGSQSKMGDAMSAGGCVPSNVLYKSLPIK